MTHPYPPPPPPPPAAPLPIAYYAYDAQGIQAAKDEQQLRLLAIFQYIWAALMALFACIPIIHVVIGVAMLRGAFGGSGGNQPPPEVGYLLIGVGGTIILLGWVLAALNFLSARGMQRRRWRMLSLILAGFNCLQVPFGTAMGVFTFVVLLRPGVAAMYDRAQATGTAR